MAVSLRVSLFLERFCQFTVTVMGEELPGPYVVI